MIIDQQHLPYFVVGSLLVNDQITQTEMRHNVCSISYTYTHTHHTPPSPVHDHTPHKTQNWHLHVSTVASIPGASRPSLDHP